VTPEVPRLGESFLYAAQWWALLFLINATGWQVLRPALNRWHDAGWVLARSLSILVAAFAVWAVAHLLPVFRADAMRTALLLVAAFVWFRSFGHARAGRPLRRTIAAAELRFVAPFVFYLAMRGLSHDIIGLEKFMDLAFVTSGLRAQMLPVPDPWFAGAAINYYYFGHYVTAFLCKLSGVPAAFGYNLMLATLFAGTFQLSYALVAEMSRDVARNTRNAVSLVAGAWITLGGNVHGFLYGFVKPWLVSSGLIDPPRQAFLISDPTRFVGWDPPTDDKLIHEFPAYAFYVGDLHAHLINLPNVILFCGVLLAWLRSRDEAGPANRGWLVAAAWLVGLFATANSWDGLMYAGMLGVILAVHFVEGVRHRAPAGAIVDGTLTVAVTLATMVPFLAHFDPPSTGFLPTHSHTPVWQWLVLYGLQAGLAAAGCAVAVGRGRDLIALPARRLLLSMTALAIAFALIPEFVYLKDIYGATFYRGNTAFKFGFQAFTLLTLAACVGVGLMLSARREGRRRLAIIALLNLALVPPLYYSWFVVKGGFGVWAEREWTLDGQRYLALSHPEDRDAAAWLAGQAGGGTLVEAVGDSYTFAARLSANTGIPTVLGWPVHEQLWRGGDPSVWVRRDDVDRLYTTTDAAAARLVIARYRPRWLVVGRFERERYGAALEPDFLASLGTVAFRSGDTFIVDLAVAQSASGARP
jgi:uncharacterized membrane protein